MKKTLTSSFVASLIIIAGCTTVTAQDEGGLVIPVELFACSYNEGKGPADLDAVTDRWNTWMDEQGLNEYSAWTLSPYYFGKEQEFDVLWLGAAKDAIALGKTQDAFLSETAGLNAGFSDVLSCDAHLNFASLNYKSLPQGATPSNSVLTFSDCSYKEGATYPLLSAAMKEWEQHLTAEGSTSAIFHWYPAYGGGNEDFSFKWIEAYQNFAELGADYERFGNGGGVEVNGKLFGHLLKCDSSRAYVAQNRRFVQLR